VRPTTKLSLSLAAVSLFASAPAAAAGDETHDGFQFRGAVGLAYISDSESFSGASGSATIYGGSGMAELYFGGAPFPGLTIGGTLGSVVAFGPSVSAGGQTATTDNSTKLNFFTIGPYVDYYPDPHGGFHVLGTLGFASLSASNGSGQSSDASTGFEIGAGVGYDWWVSANWSLGILGRFTIAPLSQSNGGVTEHDTTIVPAVLFSFTYQ
jgi:hypothetical protein